MKHGALSSFVTFCKKLFQEHLENEGSRSIYVRKTFPDCVPSAIYEQRYLKSQRPFIQSRGRGGQEKLWIAAEAQESQMLIVR